MPWTAKDATKYTKKATTPKLRKQWAAVANSTLKRCVDDGGDTDKCEASAIRQANGAIAEVEEVEEMSIAQQAIETARALVNDSAMLAKLAEARGKTPQRVANRMLDDLEQQLKAEGAEPAATSEAAMGESYGEDEVYIPGAIVSFADLQTAEQTNEAAERMRVLTYQFKELVSNIMFSSDVKDKAGALRTLTDEFAGLIEDKIGDVEQAGSGEPEPPEPPEMPEMGEVFTESAGNVSGLEDFTGDLAELGIEAAIETGRRAPVLVDFQVIEPGPGNKQDNHYYPAEMLRRDAPVFEGVDIFATDHKETERSERTKVGRVKTCPARFTESGAPVAQVIIYDPAQAEKTRNRADAGELATMECSIFARGISEAGEVGGAEYKIVKQITEGKYLELVSSAGAGGHALGLAESDNGGDDMTLENVTDEQTEVEEVEIQEVEQSVEMPTEEAAPAEGETMPVEEATPESLAEAAVETALAETNLPGAFRAALSKGAYANADALKAAIAEAIAEVKALTGSGQVFGQGATTPAEDKALTIDERELQDVRSFNETMREVGCDPIPVPNHLQYLIEGGK